MDILFRGFNQQFSVVFAEMLSEKVKAVLDVCDEGFLLRESQPAFFHELLHERFHFVLQDLFWLACDDKIVGKTNEIDLFMLSITERFGKLLTKLLLKTV